MYDKITVLVDEGRAVGIVYLDFSKAFDTASHKILIDKVFMYGLVEQMVRWTENWLNGQAQRMVISGTKSSWRPVTSNVPQGSVLYPVPFNILINALDNGADCILSMFAGKKKLGGAADTPEGFDAIQMDLVSLEKWADNNLMKFNKDKCKVLHLGRNSLSHQYTLEATHMKSRLAENKLGVMVNTKLNMSQQ